MKTLYFSFIFLLLLYLSKGAISRPLISDGVSDGFHEDESNSLIRIFDGKLDSNSSSSDDDEKDEGEAIYVCEQMYGFLPCSKTAAGHLFLILVYEFLLFHGESYVANGGERIFKILGPGVFGASAFQIIGSLPEALILLASGMLSNEEEAHEYVLTGVGLLAGSTIFLLTLLWGTCVILGSQDFHHHFNSISSLNPLERLFFSLWPGYGVVTDSGARKTARIMLLSVIPLLMIQIPRIFSSSSVERIFVITTLVVSIMFLLCYFIYHVFKPWIQRRRLLYIKHEHLVLDILKHVQNQTRGNLLTENGSPNVLAIRRLFIERDQDGDKVISFSELKQFLEEIKFSKLQTDKDNIIADIMKEFDGDGDEKITMDEFVNGMIKWIDDTKDALNKRYHSVKSLKDLFQVLKPWIEKKREEREMMKHLIPDILDYLQNSMYGSLVNEDGTPDIPAIKRLFKDIDLDKDDCISYFELKELVTKIQSGIIPYDVDTVVFKIMEELDTSKDQLISETEFVAGLSKWLSIPHEHTSSSEGNEEAKYQKTWEQTDKLIEDKFIDKSPLAWVKAVAFLGLGIVMLGLLAEPLIHSVREFSRSAEIPSFYIAFIFVPLATNARIAVSAIQESRRKKLRTTSLTLSEIYGTVFMNNVLGLVVLLSLICFRGVPWNFAAEVMVVLIVCGVIGCGASISSVSPIWTSFLAYLLYPLSLVLVYVLGGSNWLARS